MNIADKLSLSRIPLTLLFLIFNQDKIISIIILFLVILTDVIDGYIARKNRIASKFGALIDPLADKVFVISALLLFFYLNKITLLEFFILIIRDIYSITEVVITLIKKSKKPHKARAFGKITTALQYFLILALILDLGLKSYLIIPIFIFSVLTIIDYIKVRWSK